WGGPCSATGHDFPATRRPIRARPKFLMVLIRWIPGSVNLGDDCEYRDSRGHVPPRPIPPPSTGPAASMIMGRLFCGCPVRYRREAAIKIAKCPHGRQPAPEADPRSEEH